MDCKLVRGAGCYSYFRRWIFFVSGSVGSFRAAIFICFVNSLVAPGCDGSIGHKV